MDSITIPVIVDENRRVVLKLPDSIPVGLADLEITVHPKGDISNGAGSGSGKTGQAGPVNPAREAARIKLAAAGYLSTIHAPPDAVALSDEEIARIGRLPPGARPSEELISEDRGPY